MCIYLQHIHDVIIASLCYIAIVLRDRLHNYIVTFVQHRIFLFCYWRVCVINENRVLNSSVWFQFSWDKTQDKPIDPSELHCARETGAFAAFKMSDKMRLPFSCLHTNI